jgi:hypothetical protein
MQVLHKLVFDEECGAIQQQLNHYIICNHAFGLAQYGSGENVFSRLVEHIGWFCFPAIVFGDTSAFTGCEHFFHRAVLEHLQFHP